MITILPVSYMLIGGCILLCGMIIARKLHWFALLDPKIARGYGELYFMIALFVIFFVNIWYSVFTLPVVLIMTLAD